MNRLHFSFWYYQYLFYRKTTRTGTETYKIPIFFMTWTRWFYYIFITEKLGTNKKFRFEIPEFWSGIGIFRSDQSSHIFFWTSNICISKKLGTDFFFGFTNFFSVTNRDFGFTGRSRIFSMNPYRKPKKDSV